MQYNTAFTFNCSIGNCVGPSKIIFTSAFFFLPFFVPSTFSPISVENRRRFFGGNIQEHCILLYYFLHTSYKYKSKFSYMVIFGLYAILFCYSFFECVIGSVWSLFRFLFNLRPGEYRITMKKHDTYISIQTHYRHTIRRHKRHKKNLAAVLITTLKKEDRNNNGQGDWNCYIYIGIHISDFSFLLLTYQTTWFYFLK